MKQESSPSELHPTRQLWLRWLNLRPEESERTFLMFAFYTLSSVGILWLEVSVAALFLGEYGAAALPWIYIASAGIGVGFGSIYTWLQKILPLRQVLVITAVLMAVPLFVFRLGLHPALLGGLTIFLMRLWLEAIYVINEVNTSIAANQLFTIREIRRTYPLISSGILAADVVSGLTLPPLRSWLGLPNIIWLAGALLCGGAAILFYLTQRYRQFFPEYSRRRTRKPDFVQRRIQGPLQRYVALVVAFFVLLQVLLLLLDFQYLSQLEQNVSVESIADYLALFSACLGIVELTTQWFISGRIIERFGIFRVAQLPPIAILILSCLSLSLLPLLVGVTLLKFVDELLRYTLVASTSPILFQPLPVAQRNKLQADVRGLAEPLSAGLTGATMLAIIWLLQHQLPISASIALEWQSSIFLAGTAVLAFLWLLSVKRLRSKYLEVLVLSADWGKLSLSQSDTHRLKRELQEVLNRPDRDFDKDAYIELLIRTDPETAAQILAPQLLALSSDLQCQSLGVMLQYPHAAYVKPVRSLMQHPPDANVLAASLRYLWLTQAETELTALQTYCQPQVEARVRATAAALMLRLGSPQEKAAATEILRRMLTHKQEQERVMGCRALGDTVYLQLLRLYIKPLLQDDCLPVRCAVLEVIAATHCEEYYSALLRGLYYPETREAARSALVRLDQDAIPLLRQLAEDLDQPLMIRSQAWHTIGQIGSLEALQLLVDRLTSSWGPTRQLLLQVLLKLPDEAGIEAVADRLGRSGIETLMTQELQFLARIYAALLDLSSGEAVQELSLMQRALHHAETDAIERLFLLMQLLYDADKIRAAAFNWRSGLRDDRARGLEILDNTIDISQKRTILKLLDQASDAKKLACLAHLIDYQPLSPAEQLRCLLDQPQLMPDWVIACCFHLARSCRWIVPTEQILAGLRSPTGLVREAVLAYLQIASPRALRKLLPRMKHDPDPVVFSQVCQIMAELGLDPPQRSRSYPMRRFDQENSGLELI